MKAKLIFALAKAGGWAASEPDRRPQPYPLSDPDGKKELVPQGVRGTMPGDTDSAEDQSAEDNAYSASLPWGRVVTKLAKFNSPTVSLSEIKDRAADGSAEQNTIPTRDAFYHARWDGVKPTLRELSGDPEEKDVDVKDLVPNQSSLKASRIMHYVKDPDAAESDPKKQNWRKHISVGPTGDGRLVVFDGHHRAAAAIASGEKKVPVMLYPKALSGV